MLILLLQTLQRSASFGRISRPISEPPSPSASRASTPAPSESGGDKSDHPDEDEPDSEEERDALSRRGSDNEDDA